jgi:lipid-binding SYLF domain-containing protein
MRKWPALPLLIVAGIFAALSPAATTSARSPLSDEDELLRTATRVFTRAVASPAAAVPAAVVMRATAIAAIPSAVKDGTRYYGKGVVSARGARPDYWTPPAVIAFEGEIPLDIESTAVDFLVFAQTRRGLEYLTVGRFASAVPYSMVPGALGHNAPVQINADLFAYARFDQYLAGVTIDDWIVDDMTASNAALYGRPFSTDDIVRGAGFFHVPSSARKWREALADYFREMT